MQIAGIQPLSLIDFPERASAIVFTQGCVFRCPYCHNPELVEMREGAMSMDAAMEELTRIRRTLSAVVVTGGEPTMQADLPEFLRQLRAMGFVIKLDTNGVNTRMVRDIFKEDLAQYVAMDLKHVWEKYNTIARTANTVALENCRETFALIQESGIPHEFRTTVLPGAHRAEDLLTIAGYLRPGERYALQEFRPTITLEKNIPMGSAIDLKDVAETMRATYPELEILVRLV